MLPNPQDTYSKFVIDTKSERFMLKQFIPNLLLTQNQNVSC